MTRRRVAVTGIGVVAACGIGRDAFWRGLLSAPPEGERRVHDFDPSLYYDNPKEARRTDRFAQFAVAAAQEALEQAGDLVADPTRRGVWIGTGVGGIATLEEQIVINHEKGERRVSPFLVPMMMANSACANVSMRFGWQGPCENTVTACAAGTHAIGNGARLIMDGRCDVVMAGGTEAAMTPTSIAGFTNMTAMSSSRRLPAVRPRPRRLRHLRRRRGARARRARDGALARRDHLRRDPRLGVDRRRPPHHRAVARWRGRHPLHGVGARRRRAHRRATSCTSTRTARRRRSTTRPKPKRWSRCSAHPGPIVTSTKGVTGPRARRRRRHRGRRGAAVDAAPPRSRRRRATRTPTPRCRRSTWSSASPARGRPARRSATRSASAATTALS